MARAVPPYGRRSVSGMDPRQLSSEAKGVGERIDLLGQEKAALEAVAQSEQETSREREIASRKVENIIRKQNRLRTSLSNIIEEIEKQREAWSGLGSAQDKYDNQLKRMERVLHSYETKVQSLTRRKKELAGAIKEVQASEKLSDEEKKKYIDSAGQLQQEYDKQLKSLGKLGNISKEVTKLGSDMMGALGAGGVGKYVGKAGLWGALAAGVVEFTGALKNAHDQLRAVRNEGILLGGMMGGPGGAMGGRGAVAGQFMGRSFAHRLMTGQTEEEQAQFMGAGIRSGVFSNIEDIYGQGGGAPGNMTQMWALGRTTGIAPEALLGQGQELMKAGVPRGQIGQALLDLANNARDAGAGIEDYLSQVMSLNQSTRKYGATLEENELIVRHFMKYLQEGSLTLADLAGIMGAGAMGKGMRGARGFIAEAAAGTGAYGDIFAGPEWAGVRGEYAGLGPVAGGARMRAGMEAGGARGLKAREDYVKMADAIATAIVEREIGFKEGTPEFLEYYSDAMEQFGVSTGETLKSAEAIHKAAEMLGDPAEMMRTAATGFMEGQGKFESNINELTDRVLDDYERMKGIQQQMSEVIMTAMYTISIGINELLAEKFGMGAFAGPQGEEVKRGMYGGLAVTTGEAIAAAKESGRAVSPGVYGLASMAASKTFGPSGWLKPEYAHLAGERPEAIGALRGYGKDIGMFSAVTKELGEERKTRERNENRFVQVLKVAAGSLIAGPMGLWALGKGVHGAATGGPTGYGRGVGFMRGFGEGMKGIPTSGPSPERIIAKTFTEPHFNILMDLDTDADSIDARVSGSMGELERRMREAARKAETERKNKLDEDIIRSGIYKGW